MHLEFHATSSPFSSRSPYLTKDVRTAIETWCDQRELYYDLYEHRTSTWDVTFRLYFHSEQDLTLFVLGFGRYRFRVVK